MAFPDGVTLTGLSGSYIRCPDVAGLDLTGDFELVMRLRCSDWTAAGNQTLAGKYVTSTNNRSFRVHVDTLGRVSVTSSSDGTTGSVATSLIAPLTPLVDDTTQWVKVTYDADDGAGNRVAALFTAADAGSNIEPGSFTANGTDTDAGTAPARFNSSAPFEIGTFNSGTLERFAGKVYRVILRSAIDGPIAADFNSELSGPTGYTDAYGNAWAIN